MKKLTILAASLATAAMAEVVPEVSNVTMGQNLNSRKVTITYSLANASAIVTFDIQTNKTGNATETESDWVSIGGENIRFATGDVWKKVESGENRKIIWRADQSWRGHKVDNARAVVTAWSLDNPPDYMVVDLADSAKANTETYYPSEGCLPGGLLTNPDYRTTKLVLRKIPAKGVEWTMGSAESEIGHDRKTEATHAVTLDANYYIGVFPVTQSQYVQVQTIRYPEAFATDGTMRPTTRVSYNELRNAKGTSNSNVPAADFNYDYPNIPHSDSFLGLLRTKTGLAFDLPSEAQWEFASRAGNGSGYWGDGSAILSADQDANLAKLGRVSYNSDSETKQTVAVGSYAPNAWGIYDMYGNVWEWCLDWYAADISALNGEVNQTSSDGRVRRGGSFYSTATACRSAARSYKVSSDKRNDDLGFRLALPIANAADGE